MYTSEEIYNMAKTFGLEVNLPNPRGEVNIEHGWLKICPKKQKYAIYYNAYADERRKEKARDEFQKFNSFMDYTHEAGTKMPLKGMCWASFDPGMTLEDMSNLIKAIRRIV